MQSKNQLNDATSNRYIQSKTVCFSISSSGIHANVFVFKGRPAHFCSLIRVAHANSAKNRRRVDAAKLLSLSESALCDDELSDDELPIAICRICPLGHIILDRPCSKFRECFYDQFLLDKEGNRTKLALPKSANFISVENRQENRKLKRYNFDNVNFVPF